MFRESLATTTIDRPWQGRHIHVRIAILSIVRRAEGQSILASLEPILGFVLYFSHLINANRTHMWLSANEKVVSVDRNERSERRATKSMFWRRSLSTVTKMHGLTNLVLEKKRKRFTPLGSPVGSHEKHCDRTFGLSHDLERKSIGGGSLVQSNALGTRSANYPIPRG